MSSIPGCFSQASGIISIIACGRLRPPSTSSSSMLSNCAESLCSGWTMGKRRSTLPKNFADESWLRRAVRWFRLPRTVLISPLWAMNRNGWASSQVGKVLVQKREWTSASALTMSGSWRSW